MHIRALLVLPLLLVLLGAAAGNTTDTRADDPFGMGEAMGRHLKENASLSLDDFKKRFGAKGTTAKLPFDPKRARYLDAFTSAKTSRGPDKAASLDEPEKQALYANGFVVSGRRAQKSFVDAYVDIWRHDQPVFITADSVMHAWHKSYDAMLETLEQRYLVGAVDALLAAAAKGVPDEEKRLADVKAFDGAVDDADVFFTVARSLLKGAPVKAALAKNDAVVARVLEAAKAEHTVDLDLFGRTRTLDFSQMKPRGHYTHTEELKRYFRAMMWCGRTDLEIAGPDGKERELAGAVVVEDVLVRTGQLETWRGIDRLLQVFVGRTDSMSPGDVAALLAVAGVDDATKADVTALRKKIENSKLGAQAINSQVRVHNPDVPGMVALPRSFTLFGQRFTLDGWALGEVVYDRVHLPGDRQRTMPTAADVAYAVFANDAAVPFIAGEIEKSGLPYQANLVSARAVIDERVEETWGESLYAQWLSALRGLSQPPAKGPALLQTQAWRERVMNAQLASWTELRHDTILYAKQTYGVSLGCAYPAGYVEPVPAFWDRLERAAAQAQAAIAAAHFPSSMKAEQAAYVEHWKNFATTAHRLGAIVAHEVKNEPMSKDDLAFLKRTAVTEERNQVCTTVTVYDGWYPKLFLNGPDEGRQADPLVADVYTHPDDGVLHEATGDVDLMVAVIDSGDDVMAFAGPVYQHYELVKPVDQRLNDEDWKAALQKTPQPHPPWTRGWRLH